MGEHQPHARGGHDHSHQHSHQHGHHRGDEFDWDAMAEHLELDAAMMTPLYEQLAAGIDWSGISRVLDIGCGPGVVACALARTAPHAEVIALDSSEPLLARVRARAEREGLAARVRALHGDLDHDLGGVLDADLVWSSMVMHHAIDLRAGLAAAYRALVPGGTLVMVEFGAPVVILRDIDPLVTSGVWSRYQAAANEALRSHLPHDPDSIAWTDLLIAAGFVDVVHTRPWIEHPAPLDDVARRWMTMHLQRGLDRTTEWFGEADAAAISQLLASVPARDDLFVRANRQVLRARRPG